MQSLTWLSLHPRNTSAQALHLLQPRTVTLSKPRLQLLPIDAEGSFLLSRYNPPTQPLLLPTWALSVKAAGRALLYPQPLENCASLFAERRLHPRTARSLRRSLVLSMQTRLRFPEIAQVSKAQKTQPVSVGAHSLRRTAMWKNLPCHLIRNSCCPSACYRCHTLFFMSYEKGSGSVTYVLGLSLLQQAGILKGRGSIVGAVSFCPKPLSPHSHAPRSMIIHLCPLSP